MEEFGSKQDPICFFCHCQPASNITSNGLRCRYKSYGPMQAKGDIEKILKIPVGEDLVAFIPVGFPAENPPLRPRKPVTEVCTIIK